MNAKKVVVLPRIHEIFINQRTGSDDARDSTSVLQLALCPVGCVIDEFVTYCNMLVQVLHKYLKVAVQLIRRKPGLICENYSTQGRCHTHHRYSRLLARFRWSAFGFLQIQQGCKLISVFEVQLSII